MFQSFGLWHSRCLWIVDRTELCHHKHLSFFKENSQLLDRQTGRQVDRQTDRQTDRQRQYSKNSREVVPGGHHSQCIPLVFKQFGHWPKNIFSRSPRLPWMRTERTTPSSSRPFGEIDSPSPYNAAMLKLSLEHCTNWSSKGQSYTLLYNSVLCLLKNILFVTFRITFCMNS